ncbi:MAG TPA: metallopeptidase TldD-related protein [Phycisphaerae bacterium]|nr:metallopeptidase TldD-related protein [Phycisphaerae bacterium]HNU44171.1 metallopeptidase TldD-related protein [Phycisphaerae bacterium]
MTNTQRLRLVRAGLGCVVLLGVGAVVAWGGEAPAGTEHPLLAIMQSELELSMQKLEGPDGSKPYFIQYAVTDDTDAYVAAALGSIFYDVENHGRVLDVDVRCGDYTLDNTHQIRGGGYGGDYGSGGGTAALPLNDDPVGTRQAIWLRTDEAFKSAVKRLAQVKANVKVKVEEEDPSPDFSQEAPAVHVGPWVTQAYDRSAWAEKVRKYSRPFRAHPQIYDSNVTLMGSVSNRLAVTSEGGRLQFGRGFWRIGIQASTIADDGMELWLYDSFDAASPDRLPGDEEVLQAVDKIIQELLALRAAPIVEPYTGPAILQNRATGVFFHEIFGHRIEGHRQKDVEEGQTYAKKLGQEILPTFLTVVDDPSQRQFKGRDLNGFYEFDDECVPGQPARLVENGVLKTFLMSRCPTRGILKSNGHGRREPGASVVARQGNLIVESTKQVPFAQLRQMLIDECKKQNKEYGLLFTDISGGFTITGRYMPQAFKVVPLIVYRVYADGRPDELVRGVDIVGTPLTSFSKILCTGDDPDIFNGTCGAESGSVPVSAVAPSILVEQIEVEKKEKAQDRPPILPAPIAEESKAPAKQP